MRFGDILRLSLSALWQQKVRSILTTLGVVFGTFVLVASVSINRGVQETILRESQKHAHLQRIQVYAAEEPVPGKEAVVEGAMSEEKRLRLRKSIELHRGRHETVQTIHIGLTPERLRALAALEHVVSVLPVTELSSRVSLRGKQADAVALGMMPDHQALRANLLLGEVPTAAGNQVAVSEYLLYRLGVANDADVAKMIGQKLRVEFHRQPPPALQFLGIFSAMRSRLDSDDEELVAKVIKELPAAFAKLDLTPEELARFQKLLVPLPVQPKAPHGQPVAEEFEIAGVFRAVLPGELRGPHDWWVYETEVLLPTKTAERIYFHPEAVRAHGAHQAVVQVDHMDNVKAVSAQIRALKLRPNSLVEFIEREQLLYAVIFGAMTCVAAVALLVAALGITNTMLISILERTREVGIMKAVGARDRHIQLIFLVEGALIGLVGGLLGLVLGWAASHPGDAYLRAMVERQRDLQLEESIFAFPWWLVAGAPLFACVVTTLAAVYPAWRAARVNPITALRHE